MPGTVAVVAARGAARHASRPSVAGVVRSALQIREMGKKDKAEKEKKKVEEDGDEEDGPVKQRLVSPIANPLASKKLTKKALKTSCLLLH